MHSAKYTYDITGTGSGRTLFSIRLIVARLPEFGSIWTIDESYNG